MSWTVFQDEPKLPPSETRALQKNRNDVRSESVMAPLGRLFTNRHFLSLCNSYGLMVGNFNAIATLLNQMYLMHFEVGTGKNIIIITKNDNTWWLFALLFPF